MGQGPRYSVPYKRKRENKTDYKKRLALVKSGKPRLVVRKTNKRIISQIVEFKPEGDETISMMTNKHLMDYGYEDAGNNIPASYLTGYLIGKHALKQGVTEAVLDIGLNVSSKQSKLYAVLKGAVDAGLQIPHGSEILPSEERIKGEHIEGFDTNLVSEVVERIDERVKA